MLAFLVEDGGQVGLDLLRIAETNIARALMRCRRTRTWAVLTPGTRMAASRSKVAAPLRSSEARRRGAAPSAGDRWGSRWRRPGLSARTISQTPTAAATAAPMSIHTSSTGRVASSSVRCFRHPAAWRPARTATTSTNAAPGRDNDRRGYQHGGKAALGPGRWVVCRLLWSPAAVSGGGVAFGRAGPVGSFASDTVSRCADGAGLGAGGPGSGVIPVLLRIRVRHAGRPRAADSPDPSRFAPETVTSRRTVKGDFCHVQAGQLSHPLGDVVLYPLTEVGDVGGVGKV